MLANGVYTLQYYIVLALTLFAFGVEVWALADAVRQRKGSFVAAGKLTKQLWLIILAVATALRPARPDQRARERRHHQPLGILSIVAVVAAAVYLTDVRPAVRQTRGGGGRRSGPYGPW